MDGKVVHSWNCEDPYECKDLPYVHTKDGHKFVFSWLVTDIKETFDMKVNNEAVEVLTYLDSSFKLSEDVAHIYKANTVIYPSPYNYRSFKIATNVTNLVFEQKPGILMHKILYKIGDITVAGIDL